MRLRADMARTLKAGSKHADHGLDGDHVRGQAVGLLLILKDSSADIGVEPGEVGDGGVLGIGFEGVGHWSGSD